MFSDLFYLILFTNSHEEMKTQWEHPKTGKKKRCAGGLLCYLSVIHRQIVVIFQAVAF